MKKLFALTAVIIFLVSFLFGGCTYFGSGVGTTTGGESTSNSIVGNDEIMID